MVISDKINVFNDGKIALLKLFCVYAKGIPFINTRMLCFRDKSKNPQL